MNINNRLFSYPVLTSDGIGGDYKSAVFDVTSSYKRNMEGLSLSYHINLDCPELAKLVYDGMAEFVIHVECTETSYRRIYTVRVQDVNISLPYTVIRGNIDQLAMIVVKQPLTDFICSDWSEDFDGISFNFERGTMLAYQNLATICIEKKLEEFKDASSIFIVCKAGKDDLMDVVLDEDKIVVKLSEKDYQTFVTYGTRIDLQSIFHTMIIFPALVYALEELSIDGASERYQDRLWYRVISNAYQQVGKSLERELADRSKSPVQLAQELMELPVTKAFTQFHELCNGGDAD